MTTAVTRILLADDDADCREMYGEILSHAGHSVVTAADGEEAMAYAVRVPFDLIILDLALPRLDGYGVLREVRGHPTLKSTPIITVSAGDREMHARALAAGANLAFEKPCLPNELERAVRTLIAGKTRPATRVRSR